MNLTTESGRARILLVDDVPSNLRALADLLSPYYELQFATRGEEALALLKQTPAPDLILLDIMMPDMNGHAVCREIKRGVETRHVPVIFITALDEATNQILGLEVGAADYITKPFDPGIALARIRNQLRQKFATDLLRSTTPPSSENRFRAMGSSWEIAFQGRPAFQLPDRQGLAYLKTLLINPHQEFSVEELVFLVVPKERERLLERAKPRVGQESVDFFRTLTETLVANQVLSGNTKPSPPADAAMQCVNLLRQDGLLEGDALDAGDDRERFRKSVGNAIRRALDEIASYDPALAAHLHHPTLHLGYRVIYQPNPALVWAF